MPGWNPKHGYDQGPPPPGFPHSSQPQYQYPPPPPGYIIPNHILHQSAVAVPQYIYPPQLNIAHFPSPTPPPPPPPTIYTTTTTFPNGYTDLTPSPKCLIHCIKTSIPPWQSRGPLPHSKLRVPTNTTVKELMQGLGCNNAKAGKNRLVEVTPGGDGKWYAGLGIKGDEKDRVKKTIREFCWDETRTGMGGDKSVVWLWATKD